MKFSKTHAKEERFLKQITPKKPDTEPLSLALKLLEKLSEVSSQALPTVKLFTYILASVQSGKQKYAFTSHAKAVVIGCSAFSESLPLRKRLSVILSVRESL